MTSHILRCSQPSHRPPEPLAVAFVNHSSLTNFASQVVFSPSPFIFPPYLSSWGPVQAVLQTKGALSCRIVCVCHVKRLCWQRWGSAGVAGVHGLQSSWLSLLMLWSSPCWRRKPNTPPTPKTEKYPTKPKPPLTLLLCAGQADQECFSVGTELLQHLSHGRLRWMLKYEEVQKMCLSAL